MDRKADRSARKRTPTTKRLRGNKERKVTLGQKKRDRREKR